MIVLSLPKIKFMGIAFACQKEITHDIIAKVIKKDNYGVFQFSSLCLILSLFLSLSRLQTYQPVFMRNVLIGCYNRAIGDLANNLPLLVPVPLTDKQPLK